MRFNLKKVLKVGPAILLAMSLITASISPAHAFFFGDPNVQRETTKFFNCVELAFSDPARHSRECGPSRGAPLFTTNGTGGIPAITPVTPEPMKKKRRHRKPPPTDCGMATMSLDIPQPTYLVAALPSNIGKSTKSDAYEPTQWQKHQSSLTIAGKKKGKKKGRGCGESSS